MSAVDWPTANARRHVLIGREMSGTLTPADADELAALQARADDEVRPGLVAAMRRLDGPSLVTYTDALAALRAECGAPARERATHASWDDGAGDGIVLYDDGRAVWIAAVRGPSDRRQRAGWTVAGMALPSYPLTPLDVAVRDAGAWLRGHHE